jgi:hypothetical protein
MNFAYLKGFVFWWGGIFLKEITAAWLVAYT